MGIFLLPAAMILFVFWYGKAAEDWRNSRIAGRDASEFGEVLDEDILRRIFREKYNYEDNEIYLKITEQIGNYAAGIVYFGGKPESQKNWYAHFTGKNWRIDAESGIPECWRTDPYGYPKEIVRSCRLQNGRLKEP